MTGIEDSKNHKSASDSQKIVDLISDINQLMRIHCDQISEQCHKHSDGLWSIEFDLLLNKLTVSHQGYHWDYTVTRHTNNIIPALQRFAQALDKRVKSFNRGSLP